MKFLIVDDSKAMQMIVHKALVTSGYSDHDYEYAFNGKEALKKIHASKPDLVLTDWHMPEMTGLELLKKIKEEHLNIKIGLITTERHEDRVTEAREAGALFVVSKPFTAETLSDAIEQILSCQVGVSPADNAVSKITLPTEKSIKKTLSSLIHHGISINEISDFSVSPHQFPFVVCLYQNSVSSGNVIAVAVMDINAACYIGASAQNVSVKEAEIVIRNQMIPKDYFDKSQLFLELLSAHITGNDDSMDASCKGVHMVNAQMEKFQSLVQKKKPGSQAYNIAIEGYGTGRLLLLVQ